MTPTTITATIQLIIAPVVMISACSIFVNGLLTRYGAINDRMRFMARECLELRFGTASQPMTAQTPYVVERLAQIDHQLPALLQRHKRLRDSILMLYVSVLLFVADMFVIAAAASGQDWLSNLVLIVFLISTISFFIGVLFAVIEIRSSHLTIMYEVTRVASLSVK